MILCQLQIKYISFATTHFEPAFQKFCASPLPTFGYCNILKQYPLAFVFFYPFIFFSAQAEAG
jgi:hypothetical protein